LLGSTPGTEDVRLLGITVVVPRGISLEMLLVLAALVRLFRVVVMLFARDSLKR